jgi:hypothetical protein
MVASQCDLLEDIFSSQSEIMIRMNVIRNAARRITNAIELQSWSGFEASSKDRNASETLGEP